MNKPHRPIRFARLPGLLAALGLSCLLPGPPRIGIGISLASESAVAPVNGPAARPANAPRRADAAEATGPGDKIDKTDKTYKAVQALGAACASPIMARARLIKKDCEPRMEAVRKLGDKAVPALTQQIALTAKPPSEIVRMDDRAEVLVGVLRQIGTRQATLALVDLMNDAAVQEVVSLMWTIDSALSSLTHTQHKPPRNQAEAKVLAAHWRTYFQEQDQAVQALGRVVRGGT